MNYLLARLSEPSTYAGAAAIVGALHLPVSDGLLGALIKLAMAGAGVAAALLAERGQS